MDFFISSISFYNEAKNIVFTVSEIKGIEKDYIVCINIISKYKEKWNEVLNGSRYSNDKELRFYFNLFYVAVTRAKNNICLFEEDINENLYEHFKDDIQAFKYFSEKDLKLDRISGWDDFFKEGIKLEKNGLYKQAIESYKNAKTDELAVSLAIKRCEALFENQQGLHIEAADKLMNIGEYDYASQCYKEADDYLNYLKALVHDKNKYEIIVEKFEYIEVNPIELVRSNNSNLEWINRFYDIYSDYCNRKEEELHHNVECIDKDILDISKEINSFLKSIKYDKTLEENV